MHNYPTNRHDPTIAIILGVLVGCLGTMLYNKQPLKAVVTVLAAMVCVAVTGGIAFLVIYPAVIVDGYLVAQRIQRGEVVGPWQFF